MHNQQQARPALMLPPEIDGVGEQASGSRAVAARISPLPSPAEWLREFGKERSQAPLLDAESHEEVEFWNAPPAYSVSESISLPPPVLAVPRSAPRVWLARVLFMAVFGTALGLLACELCRLLLHRAT